MDRRTQEIISELKKQGFSRGEMLDALCDGEFLLNCPDWTQEEIECAYYVLSQE